MFIIAHQQTPVCPWLLQQRKQIPEIGGRRPLADHHPLALADALFRLLDRRTLMVISNTCGNVTIQLPAREQRGVAVYRPSVADSCADFFHNLSITGYDTWIIHNLRQS